ncbi:amino acid ABC transporter permease [Candidatus Methylacidithermus pantelleriae]|uniref:Amino acid ABC transporter permease n=1 Tax=Candidatus Methylacidithermus pantelleriae TaxID=2744239 RepID=A0A8J2BQT7_9BACT|nr:amino acid ABC transporter permease [Candidatus Methylacidithermus pantelleriae]CAF0689598.1 Amino acid ABC transporter permease [Candidatus Methylacidithermus pantelleriae]
MRGVSQDRLRWVSFVSGTIGFLFLLFVLWKAAIQYPWSWQAPIRYHARFVQGWVATLGIAAESLLLSTSLGGLLTLLEFFSQGPLRWGLLLYIRLVRGTPILVFTLVMYYLVAQALGVTDRWTAAVAILSTFHAAYLAEILRGGIQSISQSQWEAAQAVGLTFGQTIRYVILPQALARILPALAGQFLILVKDSSILSVIAVDELTKASQEVASLTYSTLESYLLMALGYWVLTLPLDQLIRVWERTLHYET